MHLHCSKVFEDLKYQDMLEMYMIFPQLPLQASKMTEQSLVVMTICTVCVILIWPMIMFLISILATPKHFNHNLCPFNTL